jgi:hypothetical protein
MEELEDKINALLNGQLTIVTLLATLDGLLKQKENTENIEEKLDRIIELLEKLVPQPITINSPITVNSEDNKNVGMDISKHLYDIANKVQRRKVTEKPKTNYSLDIYLGLIDDKGNVISKQPLYEEDGSIKDWSLGK